MSALKRRTSKALSAFPGQHRESRYSMYRLLVIILGFIVCGLLVIVGAQYVRQYQAGQALIEMEAKINEMRERQAELEEEIQRLQDLDYIEVLARERLGLVRPDEVIFQFED
jgi:cell division protein FtsB